MGVLQEFTNLGLGSGKEIARTVTAVAGLGYTAIQSFKRVPHNHAGLRTFREKPIIQRGRREGEFRSALGAGIYPVVPFFGDIKSTSTQERPEDLPSFTVECEDGKYTCDATISWHVQQRFKEARRFWNRKPLTEQQKQDIKDDTADLYKAMYTVQDEKLDNRVRAIASAGILLAVSRFTRDEALEPGRVYDSVVENYEPEFNKYGVVLESVLIRSLSRSEAQVLGDAVGDPGGPNRATNPSLKAGLHLLGNDPA